MLIPSAPLLDSNLLLFRTIMLCVSYYQSTLFQSFFYFYEPEVRDTKKLMIAIGYQDGRCQYSLEGRSL